MSKRVGTLAFIAPEIISQRYNEKTDIWAVGVIMYQLIYKWRTTIQRNRLIIDATLNH